VIINEKAVDNQNTEQKISACFVYFNLPPFSPLNTNTTRNPSGFQYTYLNELFCVLFSSLYILLSPHYFQTKSEKLLNQGC